MAAPNIRPACHPFVSVEKVRQNAVGVGMVIAATIILPQSDVYAEEVLKAAGIRSIGDMRAIGCDDYDIDQLRDLVKEMQRKHRSDIRRAALKSTAAKEGRAS